MKIVVVNPFNRSANVLEWLDNRKVDLKRSVGEIIKHYKGFEGELSEIIDYDDQLFGSSKAILVVGSRSELLHAETDSFLAGYEYGICEPDCTLYSSIFNEVLFGALKELREFYHLLNDNLLFPNLDTVEKYVQVHNKLHEEGRDVEWPDFMSIHEVWRVMS